ncbi:MAG: glycosyltransferase family 4 protein [Caldilineales bacterium]|nr:glycosyltransferase family 4 protein [Caldilineales bacterium]MCX7853635.1 glycosyltransferase family 4 protein [Caldilineales bacterium]
MRIGIDVRLAYYRQGGISWYAIRLLTALAKIDTENEYLLLQDRRQREPLVQAPNFHRIGLFTPAHHRLEQWPLSLETRRLGLDLIHSPDFIPPLHNRIPAVITVHDLGFVLFPHFLTADAARYYGQTELAARRASRIIAVSHSTANDLVRLMGVPEAKITVIYEAADPVFSPLPRDEAKTHLAEAGLRVPDEFILFVGTIEPRKNLHTLLEAYHRLRRDYRVALPLVLAGAPGWLHDDIMKRVHELGLQAHVHFLGTVASNTALRGLYNLAVMLAHPAYYEGFGLTVLEAMACGTPVICSNAGSLPEVAGDAALLIAPDDTEAWAAAMYRLLDDTALQAELRARGLRQAARFSWEKAACETLAVYRQAVTVGV